MRAPSRHVDLSQHGSTLLLLLLLLLLLSLYHLCPLCQLCQRPELKWPPVYGVRSCAGLMQLHKPQEHVLHVFLWMLQVSRSLINDARLREWRSNLSYPSCLKHLGRSSVCTQAIIPTASPIPQPLRPWASGPKTQRMKPKLDHSHECQLRETKRDATSMAGPNP